METLPTGIQSLSTIRKNGLRYVDKTDFALRLVNSKRKYFLARPLRFGKNLFKGLAIHAQ